MDNIISKKETKENTFFQGEYRNYNQDRKRKLEKELLFFLKENGLTISQAKDLFNNVINSLEYYGTLLTIAEYEKMTGRDVNFGLDK